MSVSHTGRREDNSLFLREVYFLLQNSKYIYCRVWFYPVK